jgi:myo-inositol-1(or 4)-monophosphatase
VTDKKVILTTMEGVAKEAGALLRRSFRRPLETRYKGTANLVTEADTASEELILERLQRYHPGVPFLSEEAGGEIIDHGLLWVIDPLDGTTNFAHGFPWFSVSIALVDNGMPILGVIFHPMVDELFSGGVAIGAFQNGVRINVSQTASLSDSLLTTGFYYHKGKELSRQIAVFERVHQRVQTVRRPGSAALDLAYVAAGYFDAFWEKGLAAWDVAAGYLLVREAGGRVTDYEGSEAAIAGEETVASNGLVHDELLASVWGA